MTEKKEKREASWDGEEKRARRTVLSDFFLLLLLVSKYVYSTWAVP